MNDALQSIIDSLGGTLQPLLDQFGLDSSSDFLDGLSGGEGDTGGTETDGTTVDGTETGGTETDGTTVDGTETDGTETDGTDTVTGEETAADATV
ncbi:hypothetical protein [Corynebacterium halotolerans]|uniref:hypothetical protein n=1 Tax=Corynebacterium halotolerans TaxID=225326 RepID=UPI003CFAC4EB